MKKVVLFAAVLLAANVSAFAGGFLTNTNQSVSFLRNPAQNAVSSVNGAYFNPAGVGFLPNGWQFSVNLMNIHQERNIKSTFAPFALEANNGGLGYKEYEAKTVVPVLPSVDATFKHNNWFGSFHFGVIAGGGKAPFDNGLGSFESQIAMLPAAVNGLTSALGMGNAIDSYSADINLLGEQYYFSTQLNVGYKILKNLSVSVGARLYFVNCSYDGGIRNIKFNPNASSPAAGMVNGLLNSPTAAAMLGDKELECKQKAFGINPIVSVAYNVWHLKLAARYEFNTSIDLKNSTKVNTTGLPQYDNGVKIANDVPAMLGTGIEWSIIPSVRFDLNYNLYFDKQSKVFNAATGKNDKTSLLKHNPYEVIAGIEWDINKHFTVSGGAQLTRFGFGDEANYISDMSFTTNSVSAGLGLRYILNRHFSFDLAVFNTFYSKLKKSMADYNFAGVKTAEALGKLAPALGGSLPPEAMGAVQEALKPENLITPGSDEFSRKSFVVGIGANFAF